MSNERIVRYTLSNMPPGRIDREKVNATTPEEIEAQAVEDDSISTEEELRNMVAVAPEDWAKEMISIRLDRDVLAFFRAAGPRYQSRINAVLRQHMDAERAALSSASRAAPASAAKPRTARLPRSLHRLSVPARRHRPGIS